MLCTDRIGAPIYMWGHRGTEPKEKWDRPRAGHTNRGEVGGRAWNASEKADGGLAWQAVGVVRFGDFGPIYGGQISRKALSPARDKQ